MILTPEQAELGFRAIWVVAAIATAALTVRWFRRFRRTEALSSVVWTTLAALPGIALLFEYLARSVQRSLDATVPNAYATSTMMLSCLWILVGPLMFLVGFLSRADLDAPHGTGTVQALHVLMWLWSTAVVLHSVASV